MIDVSPFIHVTDFVGARKALVTAYKNLAVLDIMFSDNEMGSEPIYAATRSFNKNFESYIELHFSQFSTYSEVPLHTFAYIGVSYDEEYGYVGRYWRHYFVLWRPPWHPLIVVDKNIWNDVVVVDNNGVVWRGWPCKTYSDTVVPSKFCNTIRLSEYGIRPSAKALGEIVTFKRDGQEIDVGPIYFHHYEQDASDEKRFRVFGWTEFPEGDPQLVQEIYFD